MKSDNVFRMPTIPVHIWKRDASGFPTYLCGIEADEAVATVAAERINLFPADMLCEVCLRIHQIDAEFLKIELRPIVRKASVH